VAANLYHEGTGGTASLCLAVRDKRRMPMVHFSPYDRKARLDFITRQPEQTFCWLASGLGSPEGLR